MKVRSYLLCLSAAIALCQAHNAKAQGMAVNTSGTSADNSAIVDASSTSQGLLMPRMTSLQRNAISLPATGLLVFQTDAPSGFYYNNGTPASPAWLLLSTGAPTGSAGGDLSGTYPNPTVGTSAITTTKIADDAVTVAKINATGTAEEGKFLQGNGTWAAPSGGGGSSLGQTFFLNFVAPSTTGQYFSSVSGSLLGVLPYQAVGVTCPVACTFDALYVNLFTSTAGTADPMTITLYKNGVATALTVTVTSSASANGTASGSNTSSVTVAAGDVLTIGSSHTTTQQNFRINVTTHCH